ncbi:MAG: tetratricopeptide repeat protein [Candidatus Longimicrobiales bacterium M2_2A_002]
MNERDIERWTREVAEDPGAPSFVELARAYRAQGRQDAARDVVLQGLEQRPEHIPAHALLALIHVEDGDRERAGDEWQTVLRLEPRNFDASRGLGFLALERGDLTAARRHLETAAEARPRDPAVRQALEVLDRREEARGSGIGDGGSRMVDRGSRIVDGGSRIGDRGVGDPARLFDELDGGAPFLGAVVLDEQGLILAGRLELDGVRSDLLGALINTAVEEARRATELLGLGGWEGMLLDCDEATLHVAGLDDGMVVLLAVDSEAPAGWAVRMAARARRLARRYMEVEA